MIGERTMKKQRKMIKALAGIIASVITCSTTVTAVTANALSPVDKPAYDVSWSDGHACGTVQVLRTTLENNTDSSKNCNVTVNIQQCYDGSEIWSVQADGDIELDINNDESDIEYSLSQITAIENNGGITVNRGKSLSCRFSSRTRINSAGVVSIDIALSNKDGDSESVVKLQNHQEIARVYVNNVKDAELNYDENTDYIDRLDANLDGKVDACDASTVLSIYADNSTNKPVETMGDYYKISEITPASTASWSKKLSLPKYLKSERSNNTAHLEYATANGQKEIEINRIMFNDDSYKITLFNEEDVEFDDIVNAGYTPTNTNSKAIGLRKVIVVPDNYTIGVEQLSDVDVDIIELDDNTEPYLSLSEYNKDDFALAGTDVRYGTKMRYVAIVIPEGVTFKRGEIANIYITPDKAHIEDETFDLVDIFGLEGWTGIKNNKEYKRIYRCGTITYAEPTGDYNYDYMLNGVINQITYMYDASVDTIDRLDTNLDGKVDACDASTILSIYACNSTNKEVKTMGDYNRYVAEEAEKKQDMESITREAIGNLIENKFNLDENKAYQLNRERTDNNVKWSINVDYTITKTSLNMSEVSGSDSSGTWVANTKLYNYSYNNEDDVYERKVKDENGEEYIDSALLTNIENVKLLDTFLADALYEDIQISSLSDNGNKITATIQMPIENFLRGNRSYDLDSVMDKETSKNISAVVTVDKATKTVKSLDFDTSTIEKVYVRSVLVKRFFDGSEETEGFRNQMYSYLGRKHENLSEDLANDPSIMDEFVGGVVGRTIIIVGQS